MSDPIRSTVSQEVEDYLKSIYKLGDGRNAVSTNELARKLSRSPAAITKMVKHLADRGLVAHVPYHGVVLTATGNKIALEIIRHHRLLELYLHRALGYSWDQVDAEAERLEHHISEAFEDRIDALLDHPHTDPHGDPIPTRDGYIAPASGTPLADANAGDVLVVCRVKDSNPAVLRYLTEIGMTLGVELQIISKQPFQGPLTIRMESSELSVGMELATHVFVSRSANGQEAVQ